MGIFGGKDKSQDKQIKQLQTDIANCWSWIQQFQKNWGIQINNNAFYSARIKELKAKDQQHDAKDAEHDNLIQALKNLGKAVDEAKTE